jgi:hypothetical protein
MQVKLASRFFLIASRTVSTFTVIANLDLAFDVFRIIVFAVVLVLILILVLILVCVFLFRHI